MKKERNLSGIYFRSKDPYTGKVTNKVFEDLTSEEQDAILNEYDNTQLKQMVKLLATTINEIGEELDLIAGYSDDSEEDEYFDEDDINVNI